MGKMGKIDRLKDIVKQGSSYNHTIMPTHLSIAQHKMKKDQCKFRAQWQDKPTRSSVLTWKTFFGSEVTRKSHHKLPILNIYIS